MMQHGQLGYIGLDLHDATIAVYGSRLLVRMSEPRRKWPLTSSYTSSAWLSVYSRMAKSSRMTRSR